MVAILNGPLAKRAMVEMEIVQPLSVRLDDDTLERSPFEHQRYSFFSMKQSSYRVLGEKKNARHLSESSNVVKFTRISANGAQKHVLDDNRFTNVCLTSRAVERSGFESSFSYSIDRLFFSPRPKYTRSVRFPWTTGTSVSRQTVELIH